MLRVGRAFRELQSQVVHMSIYLSVSVCIYVYICMYACICICWCKCMCIGKRIRVRVYIYIHTYTYTCACVRICAYARIQGSTYIYIYTHTCTNFDCVCYDVLHAPPLSGSRVQEQNVSLASLWFHADCPPSIILYSFGFCCQVRVASQLYAQGVQHRLHSGTTCPLLQELANGRLAMMAIIGTLLRSSVFIPLS